VFGSIYDGPPTRFTGGEVRDALIGEGSQLAGGRIIRSVIGSGVRIGKGAEIEESVIMDRVEIGPGVKLKGAIVDRFHIVPAGTAVGVGTGADERRYFRDP
jgi:glucose-1-phosphate adenylyltransferase